MKRNLTYADKAIFWARVSLIFSGIAIASAIAVVIIQLWPIS